MSEQTYGYGNETQPTGEDHENGPRGLREAKERAERRARDAEAERDAAHRELVFLKAGLNPDQDPKLAYFVKGYEGDLNPDAIKKAAVEAGFVEAPQPSPEQQQVEQALAAHAQQSAVMAGAAPATQAPGRYDQDALREVAAQAARAGKNPAKAMAEWLASQGQPVRYS